jgi:hypothetical protein
MALGLLVYSVSDGFLVGYLWTRIELSSRLRRAAELLVATDPILKSDPPAAPPPLPPAPVSSAGAPTTPDVA